MERVPRVRDVVGEDRRMYLRSDEPTTSDRRLVGSLHQTTVCRIYLSPARKRASVLRKETSLSLENKKIVLIGGGSGLGFEVARLCLSRGAEVVIAGRNTNRLSSACESLGPGATWHQVDVMDSESLERLFDRQASIDCLFSTAGVYVSGSMRHLTVEEAMTAFDAKFWGQYRAVKLALPRLSADASIVLMAGADSARPTAATPAYVACNSAMEGLGRGLAIELAPIRVNTISPGMMDGNFWLTRKSEAERAEALTRYGSRSPLGRVGTESEVAHGVVFLFESTFLTGSTLFLDGGFSLR